MVDANNNGKFTAKQVKKGDLIRSADWNHAIKEIERLGNTTSNLNKNDFKGALTIEEALNVKGKVDIGTKEKKVEVTIEGDLTVNGTISGKIDPKNITSGTIKGDLTVSGNITITSNKTNDYFKKDDSNAVPTVSAVKAYINELLKPYTPSQLVFDLGNGVPLEMRLIPGGTFLMGSADGEGEESERPQHQVTVPPFYIGKYQVTQAQWKAVMGNNNPSSSFQGDNNPVETVSWNLCYGNDGSFCKKLTKKLESQGNREFRLPSEAEWEYACRAGTSTKYSFGDDEAQLGDYAWFKRIVGNSPKTTHPVGKKKPNMWGLYDMHGNVKEWCLDKWHDNYENAPTDGSECNTARLRGGRGGNKENSVRVDYTRTR